MKIASWNVNGLRACVRKGFVSWLRRCGMDVVALQETRVDTLHVPPEVTRLRSWRMELVAAERIGYSGVATLSRVPPDQSHRRLGEPFDHEGRLLRSWFGRLQVVNSYFPNGNGKLRDNSRIPFKLDYYRALFELLREDMERGEPIVVVGDFNTAHREIDIARPKENIKTSGFTPIERQEIDRWLAAGWVDAFRFLHPQRVQYSWWSSRFGVREKNIGWRLDYTMLSPAAAKFVRGAGILTQVQGSDHCPVVVELDDQGLM